MKPPATGPSMGQSGWGWPRSSSPDEFRSGNVCTRVSRQRAPSWPRHNLAECGRRRGCGCCSKRRRGMTEGKRPIAEENTRGCRSDRHPPLIGINRRGSSVTRKHRFHAERATDKALAMVGTAVFKMVVSRDSMKKATATSHGSNRFTDSPEKLGARRRCRNWRESC